MDIDTPTINQLKRAVAIKQKIEDLNEELRRILRVSGNSAAVSSPKRTMNAAVRRKIAAAQRARWAKMRRAKPATITVRLPAKAKKKTFSRATRAKLSARMKAYWAAKRAGKK
jgi:hypothetical protein